MAMDASNIHRQHKSICLLISLEGLLGVIVACLPVIKPVFNKLRITKIWGEVATGGTGEESGLTPFAKKASRMEHTPFVEYSSKTETSFKGSEDGKQDGFAP